jgi:uncharacterized membrane protein
MNGKDDPTEDPIAAGEYFGRNDTAAQAADDNESDESLVEPDVPESEPAEPGDTTGGRVKSKKKPSSISGRKFRKRDLIRVDHLRPNLAARIRADHPNLPRDARISRTELARYRMMYVEELLQQEHGEFTELDRQVDESIARQDTISENSEEEFEEHRTLGQKLSDHLASFGGSWAFLISFSIVLMVWIGINVWQGQTQAFDPYPFILLNLVLSCIAAVQAPIIMMSQKRQEAKDRLRSFNDYRVNLKAELEIRHLHEKMDYLISRQWQRLAEMQHMQIEMMEEARGDPRPRKVRRPTPPRSTAK